MPSADLADSSTLPVPAFAVAMLSFAACCRRQKFCQGVAVKDFISSHLLPS